MSECWLKIVHWKLQKTRWRKRVTLVLDGISVQIWGRVGPGLQRITSCLFTAFKVAGTESNHKKRRKQINDDRRKLHNSSHSHRIMFCTNFLHRILHSIFTKAALNIWTENGYFSNYYGNWSVSRFVKCGRALWKIPRLDNIGHKDRHQPELYLILLLKSGIL